MAISDRQAPESASQLALPGWQRAVLKIGSSLIAPAGSTLDPTRLDAIAGWVNTMRARGKEIVLVSSGAVACGRALMPASNNDKPRTLTRKQALAAIGQGALMQAWQRLIDTPVAQVLLTRADLADHRRRGYVRRTLNELLTLNALPVINENDTVAVDELRLGDNDTLAAHVAVLCNAELLIIGSDVDALCDRDPTVHADAKKLHVIEQIDAGIYAAAGGSRSGVGTGGMSTKVRAADYAAQAGIATLICNGRRAETFQAIAAGQNPGTLFRCPQPVDMARHYSPRHYWLRHLQPVRGRLLIDAGAAQALREHGASLLLQGIRECEGNFRRGDVVIIAEAPAATNDAGATCDASSTTSNTSTGTKSGTSPRIVARGRVRCDASDLQLSRDKLTRGQVIVHRDQLALDIQN